eukprot:GCRY01006727.1.p1 GENE.GCRY01006727.1~~GCRY01006727.1.p1  ORF type:complete len:189 (+),score=37.25 GCRY01006727.1:104-670(+)
MIELFGGAVVCDIPPRFFDISQLRQVPDNQEVFTDANRDETLVVELLALDHSVSDENCPKYYYDEQISDNEAKVITDFPEEMVPLTPDTCPLLSEFEGSKGTAVFGRWAISKFKESARNEVSVCMAVVRLPQFETDLTLTLYHPVAIAPESSSFENIEKSGESLSEQDNKVFFNAVKTFQLVDPGLFG